MMATQDQINAYRAGPDTTIGTPSSLFEVTCDAMRYGGVQYVGGDLVQVADVDAGRFLAVGAINATVGTWAAHEADRAAQAELGRLGYQRARAYAANHAANRWIAGRWT